MLTSLKLRNFRCFDVIEIALASGANVIVGPNAQGKTSLLEAACILLRLQSPRVARPAAAIQHGKKWFALDGYAGGRHLQFLYGADHRKLLLDSVEQKTASEYLQVARVVFFGSTDIDLVRGPAEGRRRFLDFATAQMEPAYRLQLRGYERALRSRNFLLRQPRPSWRQIAAFDQPLLESGGYLIAARRRLIEALQPHAAAAQEMISGVNETLQVEYAPGGGEDFATTLAAARDEDLRLRQTTTGPHRDDLFFRLGVFGSEFASEGQQRTIALALKLAQAALLAAHTGATPVLMIDDVFGELDPNRRNALLRHLPAGSQKFITTTHLDWMEPEFEARVWRLQNGTLSRCSGGD